MTSAQLRYLFIALAILLATGLYFAPSQINNKPKAASIEKVKPKEISEAETITASKALLKDEQKNYISSLEEKLKADSSKLFLYDSLGMAWDEAKSPSIAAYYFELKSRISPTEENYLKAAYRYFDAFKITEDSLLHAQLAQKAIANYSKVLELNPSNLNAKTDLGICYAEGTGDPMKGIMLLRDVLNENPEHEMAQLNLGFLSVKSKQFDKAIDRFRKVMTINPKRKDVYYFLGMTYYEAGKKDSALLWLEKIKLESDDYQLVQQAQQLINHLKSN